MDFPLTTGGVCFIDEEDLPLIAGIKWYAVKDGTNIYAAASVWNPLTKKTKTLRMHRIILGVPSGVLIDHRDGNGLNNRKQNLRVATCRTNGFNRRKNTTSRSRFKGVSPGSRGRWRAYIRSASGSDLYLGTFPTEEEAAVVWDAAARVEHGEFARTNF